MNIETLQQPDSAIAKITLDAQEELLAEAGSMIAMSDFINVSTTLRQGKGGGILGGLKRMMAGESLFLSVFRCYQPNGEIYLAPHLMGDILVYEMMGNELVVQSGSYLACASGVDIELGFQGFKSLFSGESVFWLQVSGSGPIILTSFGGIYEIDVDGEYVVDTGNIVAFEKTLDFRITKASSSLIGSFLGGEGLVCRFSGRGKLFCQTHSPKSFGTTIGPKLPPR
ncbi:TIGR00266 family protein [Cyanobacterium stanieri LEGE 03274]|uniref:TIGR00266 family protein n=1 Tax=Cyanobacterium stanieri LEGE 03274 TaxID=1828756 RepID=A0ABR9V5K6_9CHRO|nr:TIGR00266 family protein [Cyanobacterium stanieri]MBE9223147.1 TIGR00266 family protein [Cyanobacterium stanieri LEGE 03274]